MAIAKAELAQIDTAKLLDYLLSHAHPKGMWKARFFGKLGFTAENAPALRNELLRIASTEPIAETITTLYGTKYVVDGVVKGPGGETALIRTVWVQEQRREGPRFVTAYPLP